MGTNLLYQKLCASWYGLRRLFPLNQKPHFDVVLKRHSLTFRHKLWQQPTDPFSNFERVHLHFFPPSFLRVDGFEISPLRFVLPQHLLNMYAPQRNTSFLRWLSVGCKIAARQPNAIRIVHTNPIKRNKQKNKK